MSEKVRPFKLDVNRDLVPYLIYVLSILGWSTIVKESEKVFKTDEAIKCSKYYCYWRDVQATSTRI
jgi:hypothetical protein